MRYYGVYKNRMVDRDDWLQEANIALWDLRCRLPGQEISNALVWTHVCRRLTDVARSWGLIKEGRRNKQRAFEHEAMSLDAELPCDEARNDGGPLTISDMLLSEEALIEDQVIGQAEADRFLAWLDGENPVWASTVRRLLAGMLQKEIAEQDGVTAEAVSKRLYMMDRHPSNPLPSSRVRA